MLRSRRRPTALTATSVPSEAVSHSSATPPRDDVEVISTLECLDEKLREISAAAAISDDADRAVFASFRMDIPSNHSGDPWSATYRASQFDLYNRISSRVDYSTANEISGYSVDPRRPFPYYTQSATTVGDQLMAVGFLIKMMNLPANSSVLEFGPGWGNTTIALARMGYAVTGRIRPQSRLSLQLPYDPASGEIVIETETWCPAMVIPGSTDGREIGIGVLEVGFC
jgi:hypothetical protein